MTNTKPTNPTDCEFISILPQYQTKQHQLLQSLHKHLGLAETVGRSRVIVCEVSTMKTPSKDKENATQLRAIEDVVFSTEMATLDFEPTLQEETFLQLIGLDRFITRVTWDIINVSVIQEVISNLNLETMESVLNGRAFPIFPKDWRNKIRASFYIVTCIAKRESDTPKVRVAEIFPTFHKKMRTKAGTCRIADCTIYEAKRPLRFLTFSFY